MCGILGELRRKDVVDRAVFGAALNTLQCRGPDAMGIYCDRGIALGHRRLSIIDLSESARQPMANEDETVWITFNGEIYNYKQLRPQLPHHHVWRSASDTEVLVHGYEEWGSSLVNQIEGMFAFAIYDRPAQRLTLARDHFGKKPLYYYHDAETFAFASELKALLALPSVRSHLTVDPLSVQKFLYYGYVPSPHSIFAQIRKLEPSTVVEFDLHNWELKRHRCYWPLEQTTLAANPGTDADVLERVDHLLDAAVAKRLQADVPVGVFLSGGVDSSLIAAHVARQAPAIEAFTVGYRNSPEADESEFATRVARRLGIHLHLCNFEDSNVRDSFVGALNYLDEPMADAAIIPLYFLSQFTRQRVTVVLSGDGGDELFGGYDKYSAQRWMERLGHARFLMALVGRFMPDRNTYRKLFACSNLSLPMRQFIWGSGSPMPDQVAALLSVDPFTLDRVFEEAEACAASFHQADVVNRCLYLDCRIQLPDWYLVKGDRATMAHSLEMRNPLLDKELAEYAFSLPGNWKLRGNRGKYLLKRIAERYVDRECIYRPKRGFGVPLAKWIRADLRDLFAEYLFRNTGYFNRKTVRRLYDQHMSGSADHQFVLLRIFAFNYFAARLLNETAPAASAS